MKLSFTSPASSSPSATYETASTHKLEQKRHRNGRVTRVYGRAQTPLARGLAAPQVAAETKGALKALHARLNPFELHRDIERQKKAIEAPRRLEA